MKEDPDGSKKLPRTRKWHDKCCTTGCYNGAMNEPAIPRFHDLARLGERARHEGRLIVMMVARSDCPYCRLLEREVFRPMIKGRDFADQILLGELFIDPGETLVDFQGRRKAAEKFAKERYGVTLTPTVLFLGPDGRELAKRMVGVNTLEMYFYYLSETIRQALARLGRAAP